MNHDLSYLGHLQHEVMARARMLEAAPVRHGATRPAHRIIMSIRRYVHQK